jgi:hypothetical protein
MKEPILISLFSFFVIIALTTRSAQGSAFSFTNDAAKFHVQNTGGDSINLGILNQDFY